MERSLSILSARVPPASVPYCEQLLGAYHFDFRLRKSRVSKIGDFTFRHGSRPRITINQELDPYLFLITFVHELAHLEVHQKFGTRVEGHGQEWKSAFLRMMQPLLNESVFPADILAPLQSHMSDPMATTYSDPELSRRLRKYDPRAEGQVLLADIPEGSVFGIRGKWFKKGKTKRTRALCHEVRSRRKYFVPVDAAVENVQLSFL